jgi:hypothetical protein
MEGVQGSLQGTRPSFEIGERPPACSLVDCLRCLLPPYASQAPGRRVYPPSAGRTNTPCGSFQSP